LFLHFRLNRKQSIEINNLVFYYYYFNFRRNKGRHTVLHCQKALTNTFFFVSSLKNDKLEHLYFSRVQLVEHELLILPEHLSSPSVFSRVRVAQSLVLCVVSCISLSVFLFFFFLAIVLSLLLRFTDSDNSLISSNCS